MRYQQIDAKHRNKVLKATTNVAYVGHSGSTFYIIHQPPNLSGWRNNSSRRGKIKK